MAELFGELAASERRVSEARARLYELHDALADSDLGVNHPWLVLARQILQARIRAHSKLVAKSTNLRSLRP